MKKLYCDKCLAEIAQVYTTITTDWPLSKKDDMPTFELCLTCTRSLREWLK